MRSPRSRARLDLLVAVALGAGLLATPASAAPPLAPPIGWREPSPVARLFLQPPFEGPEVLPPEQLEVGVPLLYSNSLLADHTDALTLDVKTETAQATLALRYGLLPGLEVQLAIPMLDDHGGLLDGTIAGVEDMFGAWNQQRRGRGHGADFRLTRADGSGIVRLGGGSGLGDVWGALKARLLGGGARGGSLSVRALAKLPTGRLPYGSEELDLGVSLLGGWTWDTRAVRFEVDALTPTARLPEVHLRTHPYGAAHLELAQRVGERVTLHAQLSAHLSPLASTGIGQLDGSTHYLLGGATFALGRAAAFEVAAIENILTPSRGADISFVVAYRSVR